MSQQIQSELAAQVEGSMAQDAASEDGLLLHLQSLNQKHFFQFLYAILSFTHYYN
jgi:hypothetical protein